MQGRKPKLLFLLHYHASPLRNSSDGIFRCNICARDLIMTESARLRAESADLYVAGTNFDLKIKSLDLFHYTLILNPNKFIHSDEARNIGS